MSDRVMRTKPAKHGKRLNGKLVHIDNGSTGVTGEYEYYKRHTFFLIQGYDSELHLCEDWTVEEIIETEEE